MFEIFGIPCGYGFVKKTMRHVGMSILLVAFVDEVKVAMFPRRFDSLEQKVKADQRLFGSHKAVGRLKSSGSYHPSSLNASDGMREKDKQNPNEEDYSGL